MSVSYEEALAMGAFDEKQRKPDEKANDLAGATIREAQQQATKRSKGIE
mgnify:FL=1